MCKCLIYISKISDIFDIFENITTFSNPVDCSTYKKFYTATTHRYCDVLLYYQHNETYFFTRYLRSSFQAVVFRCVPPSEAPLGGSLMNRTVSMTQTTPNAGVTYRTSQSCVH